MKERTKQKSGHKKRICFFFYSRSLSRVSYLSTRRCMPERRPYRSSIFREERQSRSGGTNLLSVLSSVIWWRPDTASLRSRLGSLLAFWLSMVSPSSVPSRAATESLSSRGVPTHEAWEGDTAKWHRAQWAEPSDETRTTSDRSEDSSGFLFHSRA